jgi:MoaA/NifB/PqqE/SkfB family radical SAM enzyme
MLLRQLNDKRGPDLVAGILKLVDHHKPIHVSLVGGEPLVRHKELSQILPQLSRRGIYTLVVTSGVIPIPAEWMSIPNVRVAVSVDGLPEHHDVRRKPATYERILKNIEGREVNIACTVTRQMMEREAYFEEYIQFWSARPEVNKIWVSIYTPQKGEQSQEILLPEQRSRLLSLLPRLERRYPKLLGNKRLAEAYAHPPANPSECTFARMSTNYTADLKTRVQPCVFGGTPDCSQCGCIISGAANWISGMVAIKPLTLGHIARGSVAVGTAVNRVLKKEEAPERWTPATNKQAA